MHQLDLFSIIQETKKAGEKQPAKLLPAEEKIIIPEKIFPQHEGSVVDIAEKVTAMKPAVKYQKKIEKETKNKRGRKSYKEMDDDIVLVEIPADEILFQKQYYSISRVAEWFHVNTSLIRFWENEFDILKPRKNRKGDRLFRPEDVKNLQLIYHLLRQRKYSIEGAKQYLKENKKKADADMQLIYSLTKFRAFLLELKANLGA